VKVCGSCEKEKFDTGFYPDKTGKNGLKSLCKTCENSQRTVRRKQVLEQIRELCEETGIRLVEVANGLPDSGQYDASHIKILHDAEIFEDMPWLFAETLAATYQKDLGLIQRGLEACRLAGVGNSYFVRRYLDGDKSVPLHEGVDYQSRVLQGLVKL
jgi:hypothetical protein